METLLEIKNLKVNFYTYKGIVKAVNIDNLRIYKGETLGLVGETGCGKSVTASAILKLIPSPGKIEGGEITFEGENLIKKKEMKKVRGKKIAMIFQDPMSSLNPVFTIGEQITRVIRTHTSMKKKKEKKKAVQMLKLVELPDPENMLKKYPHELSGGQRQRVMIVMALSCNPSLLIADEPTTALDVTIQAQILKLLNNLKNKIDASILLITHDIGVIAQICDRVAVMYAGNIVEYGSIKEIFKNPKHPYTVGLLETIPNPKKKVETLPVIRGTVPNLINPPLGCRFHPRCKYIKDICKKEKPSLTKVGEEHKVACFLYGDQK